MNNNPMISSGPRPLRVLIGTPAGGGQVTLQYMLSLCETFQHAMNMKKAVEYRNMLRKAASEGMINEENTKLLQHLEQSNLIDLDIGLYTLSNESLLSRGRNHIAAVCMRQGWDKLFFIDADAKWTWTQFLSIALSQHDLIAGVCPLKLLPIHLNYLPFKDDAFYHKGNMRTVESLLALKEGHKSRYISVAYVGTAFMCLTRNVLLRCAEASEEYQYPNPSTGHIHTHWNMFDTKPMHGKFMSEDWSMCERWRSLGGQVMIDADVCISHIGSFTFGPELAPIKAELRPQPQEAGQVNT